MTYVLAVVAGVVVGATIATAITYRALTRRYDLRSYDQVHVEATNVRAVVEVAEERVEEAITEAKAWVGDLLDKVADQAHELERLTAAQARRRSPMPAYGAHR